MEEKIIIRAKYKKYTLRITISYKQHDYNDIERRRKS